MADSVTVGERLTLGRTGLSVSPICYGSWQLSPKFWGDQPEDVMIAAMRRAFEVGVNFYDTADAYGEGLAETVMGKALRDLPRDQLVIATKVFWHFSEDRPRYPDLTHDYIMRACEDSLRRLQMSHIDLYQIHSYDPLVDSHETFQALNTLVRQGKVRAYGVSNWSVEQMRYGAACGGDIGSLQPKYNLIQNTIEVDLLPYCQAHHIGTLVYSPLYKGLLTGKYRGDESFSDHRGQQADFCGERFKALCDRVAQLRDIAADHAMTITQLVLAVTLMHPGINCAIVGIKEPRHIEEAAAVMGHTISRRDSHLVRSLLKG